MYLLSAISNRGNRCQSDCHISLSVTHTPASSLPTTSGTSSLSLPRNLTTISSSSPFRAFSPSFLLIEILASPIVRSCVGLHGGVIYSEPFFA